MVCELIDRQAAADDLLKRSKAEQLILAKSLLESVLNDITGMQNTVEMLECLYKRYDTYSSCTIDLCNFKMSWSACLQQERRWDI